MGIIGIALTIFLCATIILLIGLIKKNVVLKIIAIVAFVISIGLIFLVWNALGHM